MCAIQERLHKSIVKDIPPDEELLLIAKKAGLLDLHGLLDQNSQQNPFYDNYNELLSL